VIVDNFILKQIERVEENASELEDRREKERETESNKL